MYEMYSSSSRRLFDLLLDKFKIGMHLDMLKGYILQCHGDFADSLMEAMDNCLDKPARLLMHHYLTNTLGLAMQADQRNNMDIMNQLDVRLLKVEFWLSRFGSSIAGI